MRKQELVSAIFDLQTWRSFLLLREMQLNQHRKFSKIDLAFTQQNLLQFSITIDQILVIWILEFVLLDVRPNTRKAPQTRGLRLAREFSERWGQVYKVDQVSKLFWVVGNDLFHPLRQHFPSHCNLLIWGTTFLYDVVSEKFRGECHWDWAWAWASSAAK